MSEKSNLVRRQFLTRAVSLVGLLPLAWVGRVFAEEQACKEPVAKDNPMLKGIGYVEKVDAKKHKNLVNGDKSLKNCWTCSLYSAAGNADEPWKSKVGGCTLLMGNAPKCQVNALGGCNSWNLKDTTKGKKYQG